MSTPEQEISKPEPQRKKNTNKLLVLLLIIFIGAAYFWYMERIGHVYEVDARIAADSITLSSRTAGWVTRFSVIAGDHVSKGQLIAQIDDREAQLKIEESEAKLLSQKALVEKLDAEIILRTQQIENSYQRALNNRLATSSKLSISEEGLAQAQTDFKRANSLFKKQLVSKQQHGRTFTKLKQAEDKVRGLQAELAASEAALDSARTERAQVTVLKKERSRLFREQEILGSVLKRQHMFLDDHQIFSPIDGVIDKTFISEKEFISPGQRLVLIHNPAHVWVETNIKETVIRQLKVGQAVTISVDAYPDLDLYGKVFRIGNSTTSEFALLPSPNPSGSFTKITQRLPVRIELDDNREETSLLRPGMMVEIDIVIK